MGVILSEGAECPAVAGEGLCRNHCSIRSDLSAVSTSPCCPAPQPLDPIAHVAGLRGWAEEPLPTLRGTAEHWRAATKSEAREGGLPFFRPQAY